MVSSGDAPIFGDTISNCDTSKLGRSSDISDARDSRPFFGGEPVGVNRLGRGGEDDDNVDEEDMLGLGRGRPEARRAPLLSKFD